VESTPAKFDGKPIAITVSVGVAENADSCSEFTELLACADQALQDAKEAGRNRVHLSAMEALQPQRSKSLPSQGSTVNSHGF
jgi:diguanylate cyclase (GGDEF)-like protein